MKINIKQLNPLVGLNSGSLIINSEYEEILKKNGITSVKDLWDKDGEPVKKILKERGTERFYLDGVEDEKIETYIKRYLPLPKKEYIKGAISLKPIFPDGAIHEWDAILAFHNANIATMIPIAAGKLPDGRTVNITRAITDYRRASDILSDSPTKAVRITLVENIAKLASKMHSAKFAHQDFYLVHLFIKDDLSVYPIDLQRLIMGKLFKRRWQIKDLAQLLFSVDGLVSRTDILRFWKIYTKSVDEKLYLNKKFISSVIKKSNRIKSRFLRKNKNN